MVRSSGLIGYERGLELMKLIAQEVRSGHVGDVLWFLEHEPVYTMGRLGKEVDILDKNIDLVDVYRGGRATYHGPGQKIVYVISNARREGFDIRLHVKKIENAVLGFLGGFGVEGFLRDKLVGVWVKAVRFGGSLRVGLGGGERLFSGLWEGLEGNDFEWAKIAAVGVGVSSGVTMHGCAVNVSVDLSAFEKIVPCGIVEDKVCSMASLGVRFDQEPLEDALEASFVRAFGLCGDGEATSAKSVFVRKSLGDIVGGDFFD